MMLYWMNPWRDSEFQLWGHAHSRRNLENFGQRFLLRRVPIDRAHFDAH